MKETLFGRCLSGFLILFSVEITKTAKPQAADNFGLYSAFIILNSAFD